MNAVTLAMILLTLIIWGAMPWYSIHALAVVIYAIPAAWVGFSTMSFLAAKMDAPKREGVKSHLALISSAPTFCRDSLDEERDEREEAEYVLQGNLSMSPANMRRSNFAAIAVAILLIAVEAAGVVSPLLRCEG
ncbi:hypothetical protein GCK32_018882 [Trichostrongylus colubriformis]|uniref:Uncharacterized protein n=1 Tax=Trichostrongylus colubriformis TaxID=6319 RepID=A0AAN8FY23_TRICO